MSRNPFGIHLWNFRKALTQVLLLLGFLAVEAIAADRTGIELERRFADKVHPFLETYCFGCHGQEKQKGKLDLSVYSTVEAVALDYRRWEVVLDKLKAEEMPPEEAKRQPARELRQGVIDWIQAMRQHEARRNAGDPGPVLARRLSNAEYNYTIRDLTGVDIRPAQEFPVDPANEAGFDNSGESLAMSPALLNKYLEASRRVAEHIVLTPAGFAFAPHPVVTETDRDKYCVRRIIDFYQKQRTDLADYFMAAWRYQHRASLGQSKATLAGLAAKDRVSSKYLALIWSTLTKPEDTGPIATLQAMWRRLPAPIGQTADAARSGCEGMRDFVVGLREKLRPAVTNLGVRGIADGSQPLVLWKDRQYAANRRRYDHGALRTERDAKPPRGPGSESRLQPAALTDSQGRVEIRSALPAEAGTPNLEPVPALIDLALVAPSQPAARARYEAALDRFCRIFPDAFYVSERVLVFLKEDKDSHGRLLSAGFHLMTGYFRDDAPLYELMLDPQSQRELDTLWEEFHFITLDSVRQYKDFIFFERAEPPRFAQGAEFDFARSEDKDATSAAKIAQLARVYLAKARSNGGEGTAVEAIQDYFKNISADIRWVEQTRLSAEPSHLQALLAFAERAYRRPLSQAEGDDLLAFYGALRAKDGLDHEEAVRDTVTSVLMSPYFCYRVDLAETDGRSPGSAGIRAGVSSVVEFAGMDAGAPRADEGVQRPAVTGASGSIPVKWKTQPLSDHALANRLSYFLWSSMPDAELLARAKAGDLHQHKVLVAETRRMLQDDRIRGLVTEFGGNWLDFRRFEEHNAVDRERFKSFDNELRQAMFEEPIHFFIDVVRRDRSVLDFLYADYTFVNPILATHYGMPEPHVNSNDWVRINDANHYERGGLLPMSVFLTKNAPGLRTSPVKRGYWVVRRLLGEQIPPPPPTVPELPSDEAKLGDLTLREALARHRQDKNCAGCHARFDAFGLVFEGFGPIGERRDKDLGGHPVDTHAMFPGGSEGAGIDGLRRYVREHRQQDFLDNLCRKLLVYALGRSLLLSDDGIIDDMRTKLAANGYRFSSLVETIVTSPQFLTRRDQNALTKR